MTEVLDRLVTIYAGEDIRYSDLRAVTLAQWLVVSDARTSALAEDHYNFAGLKWRRELSGLASSIPAGRPDADYCHFATLESFIAGYWAFFNRAPYSGWESYGDDPLGFIRFIGPIFAPNSDHAARVLAKLPEAEARLKAKPSDLPAEGRLKSLGAIVIDPGHGGIRKEESSTPNNAISVSGVKEKKLTLDFSLILRDALLREAAAAGHSLEVILTRTTDVNLSGPARAALAGRTNARAFLSVHFNGSSHPSVRGADTFYRSAANSNVNLAADKAFAKAVQTGLMTGLQSVDPQAKDRGSKPDDLTGAGSLAVLNDGHLGNKRRPDPCVAALVEIEFITFPRIDKLLISGPDAIPHRKANHKRCGAVSASLLC